MSKITYADKISLVTSPLPDENKVTDNDMNEIKSVVNTNADTLDLVAETGSNTNGTYIKFPSGVMICTKKVSLTGINIDTTIGNLYRSVNITLGNFAQIFASTPVCTITISSNPAIWGWIGEHTSLSASSPGAIQIHAPTSVTNKSCTIEIIAIGTYSV